MEALSHKWSLAEKHLSALEIEAKVVIRFPLFCSSETCAVRKLKSDCLIHCFYGLTSLLGDLVRISWPTCLSDEFGIRVNEELILGHSRPGQTYFEELLGIWIDH